MKTIKNIPHILAFGSLLILAACGTKGNPLKSEIPLGQIPVKIWNIEIFEGLIPLHGSGKFTTDDEIILSFKTGGIISEVFVSEGDLVKKGQVLATLDMTEINTGVAQAQLVYEKALRNFERTGRLLADSVATLEQVQNSKTALDLAGQTLAAVNFNKAYSLIRAPKEGYVLKKFANAGQQVSAGSAVVQINGTAKGSWKLKVAMSDKDWAAISEGNSATIQTAVEADKNHAATVVQKTKLADPMTGAYVVELEFLENEPEFLASGMFGSAIIFTKTKQISWNIPFEALLDANGGHGFVFITEDGLKAKKITVKTGSIFHDRIQILEGLENYSQLIISGSAYLTDQSPIKIQQ